MELCLNNPFRILGLTATANEREITKRISDLLIYAEMQKQKNYDLDLTFIKPVIRTVDTIQEAKKKIEQAEERLYNSLFWFWNISSVDQLALDYLKESNIPKAMELLNKGIKTGISEKNITSHINLAILYLVQYRSNGTLNKEALKSGLNIFGRLFSSDILLNLFSRKITYVDSKLMDQLISRFTNTLVNETDKELSPKEVIELVEKFDVNYKDIAISRYSSKQIDDIENEVRATQNKRLKNPHKSYTFGNELYRNVKNDLEYLKSILTISSIKYEMVADMVAEEIISCSIAYFNHFVSNNELDPGEDALRLLKIGQELGVGATIKKRIRDNLPVIEKWIEEKPERDVYLKCWYCGIGEPDKSLAVKVPMHVVVDNRISIFDSPYFPRTIRYKSYNVEVNRCKICNQRHNSNNDGYSILIGISVFLVGSIMLSQIIENTGTAVGVSLVIGFLGIFISHYKLNNRDIKKFGGQVIKGVNDYKNHPFILKLKSEGWDFGSKPPNVQ